MLFILFLLICGPSIHKLHPIKLDILYQVTQSMITVGRKNLAFHQRRGQSLISGSNNPSVCRCSNTGAWLWLKSNNSNVEIVEYGKVVQFLNMGEATLLLGVRREVGEIYLNLYTSGQGDTCFARTLRHAANMAVDASADAFIPQLALAPIKIALAGSSLTVETLLGKLALEAAGILIDLAGGENLSEAVKSALAGRIIDSLYTKTVGDIISIPLSEGSLVILEEEMDRLSRDRISNNSSISIGYKSGVFTADMDAKLNIEYDPITRTLTGVIVSTCAPQGIAFFYRVDPQTGHMATPTLAWDGRVHFIDLSNGEGLP